MNFLKKKGKNDCSMNGHYFKNIADGLTYLFIAFLLPVVMLICEMIFSIDNASYLLLSVLILTFSLCRDYFFAYYDRVNSKYLVFGILLGVQLLFVGVFYKVIGEISGVAGYESIFKVCYCVFCILSSFFILFPLPYFAKDCKVLAQEYFNQKKNCIVLGPLSQNNMVHGAIYTSEENS